MSVTPTYDFGTVRLFEDAGVIEAHFHKDDLATRAVVKARKGYFDRDRRAWRVTARYTRTTTGEIVAEIRESLVKAAPEKWLKALPGLCKLAATTRDFGIKLGEGGMRVQLPAGHKHEWTLKNKVEGAFQDGPSCWIVPASHCAGPVVHGLISDVMQDDQKALAAAVDYLEGFDLTGELDLVEGEAEAIGLSPGGIVFSNPSFLRKVDPKLEHEPVKEYAYLVKACGDGEEGRKRVRLAVVTGTKGWTVLRTRLASPESTRTMPLDVRHVAGAWVRRRG